MEKMIRTNHKGYMMLNRDFDHNELLHHESHAKFYTQINSNTLILDERAYKHDPAIEEVLTYFYTPDNDDSSLCEKFVMDTKNEFIFALFTHSYVTRKLSYVSIWLPYSIEVFSEEQISFLEELLEICKDLEDIGFMENKTMELIDPNYSYKNPVSQKIELLKKIINLAKEHIETQKIRKKEI